MPFPNQRKRNEPRKRPVRLEDDVVLARLPVSRFHPDTKLHSLSFPWARYHVSAFKKPSEALQTQVRTILATSNCQNPYLQRIMLQVFPDEFKSDETGKLTDGEIHKDFFNGDTRLKQANREWKTSANEYTEREQWSLPISLIQDGREIAVKQMGRAARNMLEVNKKLVQDPDKETWLTLAPLCASPRFYARGPIVGDGSAVSGILGVSDLLSKVVDELSFGDRANLALTCRFHFQAVMHQYGVWDMRMGDFTGPGKRNLMVVNARSACKKERTSFLQLTQHTFMCLEHLNTTLAKTRLERLELHNQDFATVETTQMLLVTLPALKRLGVFNCIHLSIDKTKELFQKVVEMNTVRCNCGLPKVAVDFAPVFFDGPKSITRLGWWGLWWNDPGFSVAPALADLVIHHVWDQSNATGVDPLDEGSAFARTLNRLPLTNGFVQKLHIALLLRDNLKQAAPKGQLSRKQCQLFRDSLAATILGDKYTPRRLSYCERKKHLTAVLPKPMLGPALNREYYLKAFWWRQDKHCCVCQVEKPAIFFSFLKKTCGVCKIIDAGAAFEDSHLRPARTLIANALSANIKDCFAKKESIHEQMKFEQRILCQRLAREKRRERRARLKEMQAQVKAAEKARAAGQMQPPQNSKGREALAQKATRNSDRVMHSSQPTLAPATKSDDSDDTASDFSGLKLSSEDEDTTVTTPNESADAAAPKHSTDVAGTDDSASEEPPKQTLHERVFAQQSKELALELACETDEQYHREERSPFRKGCHHAASRGPWGLFRTLYEQHKGVDRLRNERQYAHPGTITARSVSAQSLSRAHYDMIRLNEDESSPLCQWGSSATNMDFVQVQLLEKHGFLPKYKRQSTPYWQDWTS